MNFEPGTLAAQVRREVAVKFSMAGSGNRSVNTPAPTAASVPQSSGIDVNTLEGCLSLVAHDRDVLLVDFAHYEGIPATVIIAAASTAQKLLVWVVGQHCSAARSDVLTHVTISR
jgi:hypothetical protein